MQIGRFVFTKMRESSEFSTSRSTCKNVLHPSLYFLKPSARTVLTQEEYVPEQNPHRFCRRLKEAFRFCRHNTYVVLSIPGRVLFTLAEFYKAHKF